MSSSVVNNTTIKPNLFGSICLLCLRTKTCTSVKSDPEKHYQSRLACIKYVVLISRYLKLDSELTKVSSKTFSSISDELKNNNEVDLKEEASKFVLCDSCLPLAESFCRVYREYEVVRLKLEEKIFESAMAIGRSTVGVEGNKNKTVSNNGIKRTGKADSKENSQLEKIEPDEDVLTSFRSKLQRAGADIKLKSVPRVQLKRSPHAEELSKAIKVAKMSGDTNSPRNGKFTSPIYIRVIRKPRFDTNDHQEFSFVNVLPPTPNSNEDNNDSEDIQVLDVIPPSAERTFEPILLAPTTVVENNLESPESALTPCNIFTCPQNDVEENQTCNINGCVKWYPKTIQGSFNMLNHLTTHKNMQCKVCNLYENSPLDLANHELKHSTSDQPFGFKCSRCSCFLSHRIEYQEHFLAQHLYTSLELVKCPVCKKGFSHVQKKQFDFHVSNCHPSIDEDLSKCYECDVCHVYFRKLETLWRHLNTDHKINSSDGSYRCNFCSEAYFTTRFVEMHQRFSCTRPDGLTCPDDNCRLSFSNIKALKTHLKTHGPELKLPECPVCKLKLYDRCSMKYHIMTHNGEQVKLVFSTGLSEGEPTVVPVENNEQKGNLETSEGTEEQLTINYQEMPSASAFDPVIASVSGSSNIKADNNPGVVDDSAVETTTFDLLDAAKYLYPEDSNDSEPFLYLGQGIPTADGNIDAPTEDPFAWILPDDYNF